MLSRRSGSRGTTLIEMLTAVTVLGMMTSILAQAFYSATRATSKAKAICEIQQVARALHTRISSDLCCATPHNFSALANGSLHANIAGLPPGPYHQALDGTGIPDDEMERMLMGGSDMLIFTSSSSGRGTSLSKVFYALRSSGELIRMSYADTTTGFMDYLMSGVMHGIDWHDHAAVAAWEEQCMVARGIQRMKFQMFDKGIGPVSEYAGGNANGSWVDSWDWSVKPYLPAAVKVEFQIVDHRWVACDDDALTNRAFNAAAMDDDSDGNGLADQPEAAEMFDGDDGQTFTFIVHLPLAMHTTGG